MDFNLSRFRNLFHPPSMIMDDPNQGGITGNLPPVDPNNALGFPAPKNPFGGLFKTNPMQIIPDNSDPYDPLARMKELYNPEHNYSDMYMEALKGMPERKDPGIMRHIGAALAGIGSGPDAAKKFLDEPYDEKMSDWATGMKAIEPGMQYERYANANDRMLANETIGREIQDRRADIAKGESERKARADENKATNDAENTAIRKSRAAAYIYRQSHPNEVFQEDDKGNLIALNPADGSAKFVLDDEGIPIKSSKLPEEDRINLIVKGRLQAIGAQGAETRRTEANKEVNRQKDIAAKGEETRKNKGGAGSEPIVTEQTVTLKDTEGKPTASKTTITKKGPEAKVIRHRVQYTVNGQTKIALVPKEKLAEALKHGGKDLGEVK